MTPLLYAVFVGDTKEAERLLQEGADPNQPSGSGETPLWHAEDDFGLHEMAALLRRYGARKVSHRHCGKGPITCLKTPEAWQAEALQKGWAE